MMGLQMPPHLRTYSVQSNGGCGPGGQPRTPREIADICTPREIADVPTGRLQTSDVRDAVLMQMSPHIRACSLPSQLATPRIRDFADARVLISPRVSACSVPGNSGGGPGSQLATHRLGEIVETRVLMSPHFSTCSVKSNGGYWLGSLPTEITAVHERHRLTPRPGSLDPEGTDLSAVNHQSISVIRSVHRSPTPVRTTFNRLSQTSSGKIKSRVTPLQVFKEEFQHEASGSGAGISGGRYAMAATGELCPRTPPLQATVPTPRTPQARGRSNPPADLDPFDLSTCIMKQTRTANSFNSPSTTSPTESKRDCDRMLSDDVVTSVSGQGSAQMSVPAVSQSSSRSASVLSAAPTSPWDHVEDTFCEGQTPSLLPGKDFVSTRGNVLNSDSAFPRDQQRGSTFVIVI